jgi:5-methylcytosine-specific restriction endonuclease McrA
MNNKLFEIQPASCRQPLVRKELDLEWHRKKKDDKKIQVIERVMFFDPTELYSRISHLIDPNKRHQSIQMEQMFPKLEGICACGCGEKPQGSKEGEERIWQRKWFNNECNDFASNVLSIINNYYEVGKKYITWYHGNKKCIKCSNISFLELDHIIPVKHGGGGCWLSNYEWKCKECHVDKTNSDFNRKKYSGNKDQTKCF